MADNEMADNEISTEVKPKDSGMIARPEYVTPAVVGGNNLPKGMEHADPYVEPSFTKIIQNLTGDPFKPPHVDGDYILLPENAKVCGMGEHFHFVPIFYYAEYCVHNPSIQVPGIPFIEEKTFDPTSDIAQRALSREPEQNTAPYKDTEFKVKYMKHDCYMLVLLDHNEGIGDTPIVHSFYSGEAKYGKILKKLIRARKVEEMYSCRFQGSVSLHSGKKGKWYGLDVVNPEDEQPWVSNEELLQFRAMYEAAAKTFKEAGITVDYNQTDDDTIDAVDVEAANTETF